MLYPNYFKEIERQVFKSGSDFGLADLNKDKKYPLLKIFRNGFEEKPIDLLVASGVHGEEIAPPLSLAGCLKGILKLALRQKINIVIFPLVNPYGFQNNRRYNEDKISCDAFWIHEKGKMAKESVLIKNNFKSCEIRYFVSLHEEYAAEEFYLYALGKKNIAKNLIKAVDKKVAVWKFGFGGEVVSNTVKDGVISNVHLGTMEDYFYHKGARASFATETPARSPLKKRIEANCLLVKEMIKIASKK